MQKQWDTHTHVRGTRLQSPTVSKSPQDYNQSPETAQYSTLYFISREELPQVKCNSLKTVQVSRLGANRVSISDQPGLHSLKALKKHQVDIEIDTEAGCNVMPLYKVHELFGQE